MGARQGIRGASADLRGLQHTYFQRGYQPQYPVRFRCALLRRRRFAGRIRCRCLRLLRRPAGKQGEGDARLLRLQRHHGRQHILPYRRGGTRPTEGRPRRNTFFYPRRVYRHGCAALRQSPLRVQHSRRDRVSSHVVRHLQARGAPSIGVAIFTVRLHRPRPAAGISTTIR